MIKLSWSTDERSIPAHLQYIAGLGKYKNKAKKENISCCPGINSNARQAEFLSDYQEALAPDLSKKQRRSKRKALKIIVSWQSLDFEKQAEFLDDFMHDNFGGHLWTWARHEKRNRAGIMCAHFHILVCPRDGEGKFIGIGPRDIRRLQAYYLKKSQSLKLRTGWDTSNLKRTKKQHTVADRKNKKGQKKTWVSGRESSPRFLK